jgi:serine/threonine protein kinase
MESNLLESVVSKMKAKGSPPFWNDTGIAIVVCGIAVYFDFIHGQGHVHREVKSANLLPDGRGKCATGDFCLSKLAESRCHAQAPEVWSVRDYTTRSMSFHSLLFFTCLQAGNAIHGSV